MTIFTHNDYITFPFTHFFDIFLFLEKRRGRKYIFDDLTNGIEFEAQNLYTRTTCSDKQMISRD